METEPQPGDSLAAFAGNIRRLLEKLAWWFKNLPLTVRALLVGITSLALFLALLSPTTSVLAVAAFGCSLVALIVRISQRKSVVGWAIATVISLVLTLALYGVDGVLYTGGPMTNTESENPALGHGSKTDNAVGIEYEVPVDVYWIKDDPLFMPGYLEVDRKNDHFYAYNLNDYPYISGDVFPNGGLYWNDVKIADLGHFDYACTYDNADPRGVKAAMQEACGFSPVVEDETR